MSLPIFDVESRYTGTNDNDTYTFDFKIFEDNQILIMIFDENGDEVSRVLGDDETGVITSLEFDTEAGGGTVVLASDLDTDYTLVLVLANDEPTQPFEFRGKSTFKLRDLENALDRLGSGLQRASWLAQRSVRMNDATDSDDFDPQLPVELTPNASIVISSDGSALALGPTADELTQAATDVADAEAAAAAAAASEANAAASAVAAATSETASAASATASAASAVSAAASAAIAAASAPVNSGPYSVTDGQAAANLTGETIDSTAFTSCLYHYEIKRGTTVFSVGSFIMAYRNGSWYLTMGEEIFDNVTHGVTFSFTGAATAQLQAALDSGAGNGTIKLKKLLFAA